MVVIHHPGADWNPTSTLRVVEKPLHLGWVFSKLLDPSPQAFLQHTCKIPATRWWVTTRWFLLTNHLFFVFAEKKKGVKNKPVGKGKIPLKSEENLVEKFDATSGIFKNLVRWCNSFWCKYFRKLTKIVGHMVSFQKEGKRSKSSSGSCLNAMSMSV